MYIPVRKHSPSLGAALVFASQHAELSFSEVGYTGLREKEVCRLKWDYEVKVPELDTSVIEAAENVCDTESRKSPATISLRRKTG